MSLWRVLWTKWTTLARKLAKYQTVVILTIFYFTIFGLYALVGKLLGKKYLESCRKGTPSFWKEKERLPVTLDSSKRQF